MEFASFSIELLSILFFVAVFAGLLDTLAGGGGLISIPALMLSGVPPLAALGTNKLQGSVGTATASYMMFRRQRVSWSGVKYLMLSAFIGAVVGTICLQFINTDVLSFVIPVVLLFIAVYFLLSPMPALTEQTPKLSNKKYQNIVVPCIGFYDGMFGPGTGSFFALSGVSCRGQDLITSTATAKPLNFSTNIASLIVFLMAGHIVWVIGLLMMLGQMLGAWLGAHCLFKINPVYLRGIVVFTCCSMLIKYANSMGWVSLF
ncbi:TSUP family transporter [Thalassotalea ganghwensis]